jgi:hypothetical protein
MWRGKSAHRFCLFAVYPLPHALHSQNFSTWAKNSSLQANDVLLIDPLKYEQRVGLKQITAAKRFVGLFRVLAMLHVQYPSHGE